jgi:cobalamin biosynthesis protein CbiD
VRGGGERRSPRWSGGWDEVEISPPAPGDVRGGPLRHRRGAEAGVPVGAEAVVVKDAGDDPDVTMART